MPGLVHWYMDAELAAGVSFDFLSDVFPLFCYFLHMETFRVYTVFKAKEQPRSLECLEMKSPVGWEGLTGSTVLFTVKVRVDSIISKWFSAQVFNNFYARLRNRPHTMLFFLGQHDEVTS